MLLSSSNKFVTTLTEVLSSTSAGGKPGKKITVGGQFSQQLADLRAKIDLTSPHYVRCLKPNDMLVPDHFDPVIVADQLRCAGVVEAVRVSRVGYPQRYSHALFVNRYRILGLQAMKNASKSTVRKQPVEVLVTAISKRILDLEREEGTGSSGSKTDDADAEMSNNDGIQVGKTKVFLRRSAYDAIEKLRNNEIRLSTITIQTVARRYLASRHLKEAVALTVQLQCLVRRMIAIQMVNEMRRQHSACVMQTYYRRMVARDAYVKTVALACWGQRYWRGRVGRARYGALNRERKAATIQKRVRGYRSAKAYSALRRSSVTVQCAIRCYRAKNELKTLQAHARDLSAVADERNVLRKEALSLRQELDEAKGKARIEAEKVAAAVAASAQAQVAADSKLEAEVEELRQQTIDLRAELDKAQEKFASTSAQLTEERETTRTLLEETKSRLAEADQAREKAEADSSAATASMEAALERAKAADESKSSSIARANHETEAAKARLAEADQAREKAEADSSAATASLEAALERAKAAEESKSSSIAKSTDETEAAKARLEEASAELVTIRQELESGKTQLVEAQKLAESTSSEAERHLQEHISERTSLKRDLETTKKQLVEAQNVAENSSEANRELLEQTSILNTLHEELEATKMQLINSQKEVESANDTKLKLEGQVSALKKVQGQAPPPPATSPKDTTSAEKITLLSDELALVVAEKESLQNDLAEVKRSLEKAKASVGSFQQELKNAEAENVHLKSLHNESGGGDSVIAPATQAVVTEVSESVKAKLEQLEEENVKLREQLQSTPQCANATDSEEDPGLSNKDDFSSLQKELLDAKATISRMEKEKSKQSHKLMLSIPEDSEPDANMVKMQEMHDEIDRLKKEICRLEDEKASGSSSGDSLLVRYQELSRLSSALVEKDKEIDELKDQITNLKAEFNDQVQLFKASSNSEDEGDTDASTKDPFETRSHLGLSCGGDAEDPSTAPDPDSESPPSHDVPKDEMEALLEINEILRKDVERARRDRETAKWEAKEERERSAKEIESFAQTLRGVDELRSAAEAMSREITKNRKYYMAEGSEGAFEAISSVNRASQLLDASQPGGSGAGGVGLWGRMTGGFGRGGGGAQDYAPEQSSAATPPRQKERRRRKKRGSDNESVISAFF